MGKRLDLCSHYIHRTNGYTLLLRTQLNDKYYYTWTPIFLGFYKPHKRSHVLKQNGLVLHFFPMYSYLLLSVMLFLFINYCNLFFIEWVLLHIADTLYTIGLRDRTHQNEGERFKECGHRSVADPKRYLVKVFLSTLNV
jgi:hypothetical protein